MSDWLFGSALLGSLGSLVGATILTQHLFPYPALWQGDIPVAIWPVMFVWILFQLGGLGLYLLGSRLWQRCQKK